MFQITISTTLGDSVQKLEGGFWGSSNMFFDLDPGSTRVLILY